jgi:hypothetical protein
MKSLLLEWLAWLIICTSFSAILCRADETKSEVEQYVTWFHQDAPNRLPAALKLVPLVEFTSRLYGVDPLLVSVIISCESSWRPGAVGMLGERGIMQVHGAAAKGFGRTTEGRLEAGVNWLRTGIRKCGYNSNALAWYNGDGCVERKYAKRRWRLYEEAKLRFRNGVDKRATYGW